MRLAAALAAAALADGGPVLAIEDVVTPTAATFPAKDPPLLAIEDVVTPTAATAEFESTPPLEEVISEPGPWPLLTPPMLHEFDFLPQEGGADLEHHFVMGDFAFDMSDSEAVAVKNVGVPAGVSEFGEFQFPPQEGGVESDVDMGDFVMDMSDSEAVAVKNVGVPAGVSEFGEFEFPPQEGGIESDVDMGDFVMDMSDSEGVVFSMLRGDNRLDQAGGHRGHHDDHHGRARPHGRAAASTCPRGWLVLVALVALIAGCVCRFLRARRAAERQGRLENEVALLQGQVRVLSSVVVSHQPAMTHVAVLPSAAEAGAAGATAYVPLPAAAACVAAPVRATAIAQATPGVVSAADSNSRPLSVPLVD